MTPAAASTPARRRSSSPTTVAVSSTPRSRARRRCLTSSPPCATGARSTSTAASAVAPTSSRRWPSVRGRCSSAVPCCGGSRRAAPTASRPSSATSSPSSSWPWPCAVAGRSRTSPPTSSPDYRAVAMDDRPIGMFDSGFGGLTVARALIVLLPGEDVVYVGDTGRYPYGPRDLDEVRQFSQQITRHLVEQCDVKLVVVACNTASAAALELLQFEFDVPVVGVINPGVRSAIAVTTNQRVGVIGTVGTIASGAYQRAVRSHRGAVELTCAACPGFVEFVEKGETDSEQVRVLAERLLDPIRQADVDTL